MNIALTFTVLYVVFNMLMGGGREPFGVSEVMLMNPVSKPKRVIDKQGMKKVKAIDYCERCGSVYCLEVAHVHGKGCGGPDIKENCIKLCGPAAMSAGCHGMDHRGEIIDDELFGIIARREGKSVEVIKEIAHRAWRFGEYDIT